MFSWLETVVIYHGHLGEVGARSPDFYAKGILFFHTVHTVSCNGHLCGIT